MTAAHYLGKLNAEQRRAVEYGCEALSKAHPLLIIAGAGSGKTNTLAHRVAHLIVLVADPRRIMLLTFSRRAAAEMQRRVERITADALGPKASAMADGLSWSGTFHALGARLLREHATDIGICSISRRVRGQWPSLPAGRRLGLSAPLSMCARRCAGCGVKSNEAGSDRCGV